LTVITIHYYLYPGKEAAKERSPGFGGVRLSGRCATVWVSPGEGIPTAFGKHS